MLVDLKMDPESDECSILAIAASSQTAIALIRRLVKDGVVDQNASSVPWTITNKYYTADVKFVIHQLSSWVLSEEELLAPAILFVWMKGEPYQEHILRLSEQVSQHEFEVALGIRLPPADPLSYAESEDEQDIDAYLSTKGFEFVDVVYPDPSSPDRSAIPGVGRVIDALSTIMWPSMVRQTAKWDTATGMIGTTRKNAGVSSDDYENLVRLVSQKVSGADKDRMRRELEELDRWLDEDMPSSDTDAQLNDDDTDPWSTAVSPGTASPTLSGFLEGSRPTTPRAGFDDDFTSFISASLANSASIPQPPSESSSSPRRVPPLASTSFSSTFSFDSSSPGCSTPTFDDRASMDTSHLTPGERPFGVSYKSLGSVSDFGDLEKESFYQERMSDEEGDEDFPSNQEIAETSRRIFGTIPFTLSPSQERGPQIEQTLAARGEVPSHSQPNEEDNEMMDADLERFDLQSVLGALQGLKEEIAGMPDKERRKTAARVALGLAYGLDDRPHS